MVFGGYHVLHFATAFWAVLHFNHFFLFLEVNML